MKRAVACLTLLAVLVAFLGVALAQEEVYVTGRVVQYSEGSGITVEDEAGIHDFALSQDTEITGDITEGAVVEIQAQGGLAVYIGVVEAVEGEEPAGE